MDRRVIRRTVGDHEIPSEYGLQIGEKDSQVSGSMCRAEVEEPNTNAIDGEGLVFSNRPGGHTVRGRGITGARSLHLLLAVLLRDDGDAGGKSVESPKMIAVSKDHGVHGFVRNIR